PTDQMEADFVLAAARPLGEPIARHGPFVRNTRENEEALRDLWTGRFIREEARINSGHAIARDRERTVRASTSLRIPSAAGKSAAPAGLPRRSLTAAPATTARRARGSCRGPVRRAT